MWSGSRLLSDIFDLKLAHFVNMIKKNKHFYLNSSIYVFS
jgi:hypothetical protein